MMHHQAHTWRAVTVDCSEPERVVRLWVGQSCGDGVKSVEQLLGAE